MSVLSFKPSAPLKKGSCPETLADAKTQQTFTIQAISESCDQALANRLFDLGFREDTSVQCIRRAPLGSPIMFRVCDTDICLRASQAKFISANLVSVAS